MNNSENKPVKNPVNNPVNNREKIWQVVHQIPKGKVASYGQVAKMAQLLGYARYVGHTLKSLPSDSKLPWFRVINSQGKISFPAGSPQYQKQKSKLEEDGVFMVNGKISMKEYQW